jgi:hypothetical protein
MSGDFLSGQNVNYILNQLFSNLEHKGVSLNPKDEQARILNFMQKCKANYPRQPIIQLNNYVIKALTEHYMKMQPSQSNLENRLEKELADRQYRNAMMRGPEPTGAGPEFGMGGPEAGYLSLDQARGVAPMGGQGAPGSEVGQGFDRDRQREREESMTVEERLAERERLRRDGLDLDLDQDQDQDGKPLSSGASGRLVDGPGPGAGSQRSIWISLSKDNLVNMSDNVLTFSWDHKLYRKVLGRNEAERTSGCHMTIEHLTLPKYYPFILVKNKNSESNTGIFNASGKGFEMKLVPVQRLLENTSYRQLGRGFMFSQKPSTLSLQLSSGSRGEEGTLGLNLIPVLKVTKINHRIKIQTKYPHNLNEADFLVIEFPEMASCYKVTNLKILDLYQIEVDSPFSGYFSCNFRLIRNNWDLDLTVKIDL